MSLCSDFISGELSLVTHLIHPLQRSRTATGRPKWQVGKHVLVFPNSIVLNSCEPHRSFYGRVSPCAVGRVTVGRGQGLYACALRHK